MRSVTLPSFGELIGPYGRIDANHGLCILVFAASHGVDQSIQQAHHMLEWRGAHSYDLRLYRTAVLGKRASYVDFLYAQVCHLTSSAHKLSFSTAITVEEPSNDSAWNRVSSVEFN